MKLITFRAESMPRALARVKKEMGSDAIILHTRTVKVGGFMGLGKRTMVEIVARKDDKGKLNGVANGNRNGKRQVTGRAKRLEKIYAASAIKSGNYAAKDVVGREVAGGDVADGGIAGGNITGKRLTGKPLAVSRIDIATNQSLSHQAAGVVRDNGYVPRGNSATPVNDDVFASGTGSRGGQLPRIGCEEPDNRLRKDISDIRELVENLVREQRQLHTPDMPEQLFDLYLNLIQREVADEMAREMMQKVRKTMTGDQLLCADLVRRKLLKVMDSMICTSGPICHNLDGTARVVTLIGPTGVGKTTTIAKIAANLKLRKNKKVGLITIDTYRIGAVDQLRMYASIIDVPLKVVLTPADLKEAVDSMRDMDVVLIDTAGRSQTDELKLQELKAFLNAARPDETHLVLSSTAHRSHMLSAAEKFKTLGVDRLIITKLDEAISFGVLLSVVRKMETSISYITTGQDVPEDIEVGNSRRLARLLLGIENVSASSGTMA